MDLQEVGWGETDWIYMAYSRNSWQAVVNAVINFWGPKKCGEFLDEMRTCYFFRKDFAPRVR